MIALPTYNIIAFLDWVKTDPRGRGDIGFVRECVMRGKHTHRGFDDIMPYATQFIKELRLDIKPYHLVNSLKFYIYMDYAEKDDKQKVEVALWHMNEKEFEPLLDENGEPYLIHMLLQSPRKLPLSLEFGFLQWLIEKNILTLEINNMPLTSFEQLARDYLLEQHGEDYSKKSMEQLVNFFKIDNPQTFLDKMKSLLPRGHVEKIKGMQYIYDRFTNPHIHKCMFLPLDSDKQLEKFINDYWMNLHALSGDLLDIYYSKDELLLCGYKVVKEIKKLNPPLSALPCLVLWKDSFMSARYIELRDLSFQKEVFHIIQEIVENIRQGLEFEDIYKEATVMADEKRENQNPAPRITQTAHTVVGAMVGVAQNSDIKVSATYTQSDKEFDKQLNKAISGITAIEEITSQQKDYLVALMNEAKSSVDESQKQVCKGKFDAFMLGIGDVSVKVISVLSGLSSIARFFGLGA